ncbi:alpha/beta hydrolase [Saccharopolyspora sp. K220]|uniref:PHB depolymerase family esterase n=1 Tax=Saccharopolyspora soli TaxID=2926618 RepID=UPI001F5A1FED|nr:PHB depolymerase family esterase [Saccharopolyspora soli]MCI2423866.1 alpha/beta hydrolase [Saccharopolyspora soli]
MIPDEHPTASTSAFYSRGKTPAFASRYDQRFSYCLYVPEDLGPNAPLVVIQHGTERNFLLYRDHLQPFADEHGVVVLAPLFPGGIIDPADLHNFKFIEYEGIRFDRVLLAMVDEVAERYPVDSGKFYLHGFSGGGQFAHRFFYLHPDRLAGVSIGAPGRITQLDDALPWWLGTQDFEERFGQPIDFEALRRVPVLMVVGDQDVETWEINNPGEPNWMDGAEKTGGTRIERLRTLERDFVAHGIDVRFVLVPGVAHRGSHVLPPVRDFFAEIIRARRRGEEPA